jgi:DNA-binding Lrp family transcriptional regulator
LSLSENEYRVLDVLLKDPSLSYTEIAHKLNLSVTSIRNLVDNASERKKTNILNFYAKFNYDLLSLERYDFFISCSTMEQLENVKQFCLFHPYTNFRARMHGGTNGIYAIFLIPKEGFDFLILSLEILKIKEFITDFKQLILDPQFIISSSLKIDVFDINLNRWNFDFDSFKQIVQDYEESISDENLFQKPKERSILPQLTNLDLMILNEWGFGAGPRKTKAELLENIQNGSSYKKYTTELKLNRYIISDHVDSLLATNIIENIGIGFDRRKILILTILFYVGEANINFLKSFSVYINSSEFPFESTLVVGKDISDSNKAPFTWWVSITPNLASKFTEFLFENSIQLQTFIVAYNSQDIDSYPLYHANFVLTENGGQWNTNKDYCLLTPLKYTLSDTFDEKEILTHITNKTKNTKNK